MWPLGNIFQNLCFLSSVFILCQNAPTDEHCGVACGMVALIPARGGSKGLPNKNISRLNNQTLVARTLSIVKSSSAFASVWVSTDSDAIAKEAENAGGSVHWRDPETGRDNSSTLSVVHDFLKSHPEVRIIGVIQCTSPFLCPNWLDKAADVMADSSVDCVFAVMRSYKLRWNGGSASFVRADNFNPQRRPRRQDWSGELFETGMFYFSKRKLVEAGHLQNDRCKVVEVPASRSMEIDSAADLNVAQALVNVLPEC